MSFFTQEQFKYARYEANAIEYARKQGYDLIKRGRFYVMRDHDSMVFTEDGKWFWNSRGIRGRAIEFVINYEQRSFREAVLILSNGMSNQHCPQKAICLPTTEEHTKFILPERADNYRKMFWYLCEKRKLDAQIVANLVKDKMLYQSKKGMNAVFVGYDKDGIARSAFQRGTWENNMSPAFKRDVCGSDKSFPFCVRGRTGANAVFVFEAAIDAISHASIYKLHGKDYEKSHRISLGGLDIKPLLRFLKEHSEIENIILALDNDLAGRKAVEDIAQKLNELYGKNSGYHLYVVFPKNKDWNEDLQEKVEQMPFFETQPDEAVM